jgi:hypothetical protein
MEQMPRKTAEELEAECLRLLHANMTTREIQRVGIVRTLPGGHGSELDLTHGVVTSVWDQSRHFDDRQAFLPQSADIHTVRRHVSKVQ